MGRSERLFLLASIAAAPALACNAILGIDDFKRTECGSEVCPFDGGEDQFAPDQFVPDAGKDSQPDAPPGAAAVSWAQFEMPNYRPDSGIVVFDPRPLQYNTSASDIVTDVVTGLVWQKSLVGNGLQDFYYGAAKTECQKITAGGPWRLPKRIELVTLLSHGGTTPPFIDKSAFNVPNNVAAVWTSSEVRTSSGVTEKFWGVNFSTGAVTQLDGRDSTDAAKVLCIKDKQK